MIVYLIKQKGITKLNLPKKVNGSYLLSDYDSYNEERQLLNIIAEDNNWVIYNNENVKIFDDTQEYTKVTLTNYRQLYVKVGEETLILYTCPVVESNYGVLEIVKNVPITIGKKDTNVLVYNNKLVSDEHAVISLINNVWVIEDKRSMYGTYVNGERINGKAYLFNGDVVFIMGLKIILMNNKLFVNNPNNLVGIKGDLFKIAQERPENNIDDHFEENNDIKLYTDEDYFSRVPRFSEKIEPAHFILDDYPTIQKPEEQPVILTVGPMLTMSLSSLSMVFVSIMNYQNHKNILSIIPTIVMGIAMIAGTFLWPTLTKRYQKKKYEKDKEEIKTKYTEYLNKKTAELNQIIMSQKQILLSNNISTREAYNMIIGKSKNLWKRELHQNDFLNIRLGLGKVPVEIDYKFPEEHFRMEEDELFTKVQSMLESHKYVEDAPIVESLIDNDVLAITGKDEHIYYFFKNLLIQIIFLHSYFDLKIVLFTNKERSKQWDFIKQLPHLFTNDKELRFFADNDEDAKEIGDRKSVV